MAWPGHMLEISRNQPSVKPWSADARSGRQTLKGSCWSTFDGGMCDFGHRPSASGLDVPLQTTTIHSLVSRSVKTLCKLRSTYKSRRENGRVNWRGSCTEQNSHHLRTSLYGLASSGWWQMGRVRSPLKYYIIVIRNWRFRIGEEKPLGAIKTQLGFDV